jgi:hypothetical protein
MNSNGELTGSVVSTTNGGVGAAAVAGLSVHLNGERRSSCNLAYT